MEVSVEKTSEIGRKMTVCLTEVAIQEKIAPKLKSLAKKAKVDGFRPGKVPTQTISKLYGAQIRDEVINDLIQSSYFEALTQENLNPAGMPHIKQTSSEDAEGFIYDAEFEVYPSVNLDGIENLPVTKLIANVEETDVDNMILRLREQRKTWQETERTSATKDRVTISFSGVCEDKNFTNGVVENFHVELGSAQMIPGFEDQLLGLQTNDQKTFEIHFPEEYGNAELAGKLARFEITVVKVEEAVLPEIDVEFVKSYGVEDGSADGFKNDVRNNMTRELQSALHRQLKNSVMTALYEKIAVPIPNTLIETEIQNMMKPYFENAKRQKIKPEELNLPREAFESTAKRRVALSLILGEVVHTHKFEVDGDKVRQQVEDMAKSYERPEDVVNWYFQDEKRLDDIKQVVMEDQLTEWLLTKSIVTTEDTTFDAVMNKSQ